MRLGEGSVFIREEEIERILNKCEEMGLLDADFLRAIHNDSMAASIFYSFHVIAILFSLVIMRDILGGDSTIQEAIESIIAEDSEGRLNTLLENKDNLSMLFGSVIWKGLEKHYEASKEAEQSEGPQTNLQ